MSRQKVPDDKRQRTAQACDYCKRRKQKVCKVKQGQGQGSWDGHAICNGTKPCSTCTKKSVTCTYATGVGPGPGTGPGTGSSMSSRPSTDDAYDGSAASSSASPPKRRHIETSSSSASTTDMNLLQHHHHHHRLSNYHTHSDSIASSISSVSSLSQPKIEVDAKARLKLKSAPHLSSSSRSWGGGRKKEVAIELETSFLQNHGQPVSAQDSGRPPTDGGLEEHTRASSTSGHEEEAILLQTTRMLQDQKGRLLYIGDSATLSFLHLFRLMVESISGQSSFTIDPRKESIVENVVSLPSYVRPPSMLPDRQTADVLVESFFINTSSIVEVFDRRAFLAELERCYANPLMASTHFLCHLFLSFAIGLVMATPDAGTVEANAMRPLLDLPYDQAELFFRTAKVMDDPLEGVEDADFWSVQAQLLMSVYMLAVSKRNAAFTYHGIAVRSAIALGLHREETMVNFTPSEVLLRRNIWKSLYVLDRFIAASLGRPPAISDNDCTDVALKDGMMIPQIAPIGSLELPSAVGQGNANTGGLAPAPPSSSSSSIHASTTGRCSKKINNFGFDASVRGCRIIGIILKKMYARRRVSSRATTDIIRQCSGWVKEMNEGLRWQRTVEATAALNAGKITHIPHAQSIAILHTNLFYCHAVILLTRPFFLFLIQADRRSHASPGSLGNFFGTLNKAGSRSGISRVSGANRSTGGFPSSGRYSPTLRTRTERFAENCVTASYHTIAMISQALETKYLPQRDPFIM
ncbi:hypothetical protein Sste5346_004021 [Sporothrix stenoceras]|uniref:Xylanolytic transcriptional activator regulatory domain-containing protein n=1 Tax=Sporothrix stenoceras TaxID=5173 RepID=A0ABR3ZAM9_9PEZI